MSRKSRLFLVLLVFVFLAGGLFGNQVAAEDIILLHTNDIHGRIEIDEEKGQMGLPYIAAVIEDYRSRYENVLVLDAGDTIHGQSVTNVLRGKPAVKVMDEIGYDVMSPGNHDFHFGYKRLFELEEIMEIDYISTNVVKDGEPILDPYTIKEVGDYKVGILGITPTYTEGVVRSEHIEGIDFIDMVDTAQHYIDVLNDNYDLDIIIGLANSSGVEVVDQLEDIDLFVDGRSHEVFPEGEWRNGILHVKAGKYTENIGKVEITFNDELVMTAEVISAEEVMAQYDYNEHAKNMLDEFREEASRALLGN